MTKIIVAFRSFTNAPKNDKQKCKIPENNKKLTPNLSSVFLNRRAVARYRALASITPGRERPIEITVCYRISSVQLITNLNVNLYLSTCHIVYISVLILFMIMP